MATKTVKICGKDVPVLYCAATETGFERLAGREISVFIPTFGTDDDGNTIIAQPAEATTEDYIRLAMAAIVAANEAEREDRHLSEDELPMPVSASDILYKAGKQEVTDLITAVAELRNQWYGLASVIKPDNQPSDDADKPKN